MTGAAWVTESELEWLCEQLETLRRERDIKIAEAAEAYDLAHRFEEQYEALAAERTAAGYPIDFYWYARAKMLEEQLEAAQKAKRPS